MRRSLLPQKMLNYVFKVPWIFQLIISIALVITSIVLLLKKDYVYNIFGYTILALSIIILINALFYMYYGIKAKKEQKKYKELLFQSNIEDIDNMNGKQFEDYLGLLYSKLGYNTKVTRYTGDYGADLVLEKDNEKIVIQAKCYRKTVPLTAIQEIVSARQYYNANSAWVVTNNYFSQPAKNLAQANNVLLIDRVKLMETIVEAKSIKQNRETRKADLNT